MRLVIDTNVFVSAALKGTSRPGAVIRWIDAHGGLLKSTATETQVISVLARPYIAGRMSAEYLANVTRILAAAEAVEVVERIAVCRDPTDDKFLELAVNGQADMIVTGDRDLLVLHPFRGIPIIDSAAFVQGVADTPGP